MGEIQAIRIRRFKALRDVVFDLGDATVLVGGNNSGKTSVLQALHFAISVAQSASLVSADGWQEDAYDVTLRPEQLIYSPTTDFTALVYSHPLGERLDAAIEVEIETQQRDRCAVLVGSGRDGNISLHMEGRNLGERIQDIFRPYTVYAPGLAGIAREETKLSQSLIRRAVARGDANLVLRNVLLSLVDPDATLDPLAGNAARPTDTSPRSWQQFKNDIVELFPGLDLQVGFVDQIDEHIQAGFQLGNDRWLPIDCAGLGILQAAQVLAYVTLFKPRLLLLDEPDAHMHPNNQAAICKLLVRLARERGFQLIVASHSRHVISAMKENASVRWVRRGVIEDVQTELTAGLLELGALDSLDYLGHPYLRCLVLTEDSHTSLLKCLLAASGFDMEQTQVLGYEGSAKLESALTLARLLRDTAPNIRIIVHRDRDYMPQAHLDRYTGQVAACGCTAFVTTPSDIEGYLLSADHINALYPLLGAPRVDEILAEATTLTRDVSIEKIINLRTEHEWRTRQKGETPNVGRISLTAHRDYDANPFVMRRGKAVLARVRLLLQQELGADVRLETPTPAIAVDDLRSMAVEIWPRA